MAAAPGTWTTTSVQQQQQQQHYHQLPYQGYHVLPPGLGPPLPPQQQQQQQQQQSSGGVGGECAVGGSLDADMACGANAEYGTACGPAEAVCFEPEAKETNTRWRFAGKGKGGYEKVQGFNFVGVGHGSYAQEEVTQYGRKLRPICLGFLVFCGVLIMVYLGITSAAGYTSTTTTASATATAASTSAAAARAADPQTQALEHLCLSREKPAEATQASCCKRFGLFCEVKKEDAAAATTAAPPPAAMTPAAAGGVAGVAPGPGEKAAASTTKAFDCNLGVSNWLLGWSDDKKSWCCKNANKGCRAVMQSGAVWGAGQAHFDCATGFDTWQTSWSDSQKAWCCLHMNKACPAAAGAKPIASAQGEAQTTTERPYDCDAGFANWMSGWSSLKKAWCCAHRRRGCPVVQGGVVISLPYDCLAGLGSWSKSWSGMKKAWCCTHQGKGCDTKPGLPSG